MAGVLVLGLGVAVPVGFVVLGFGAVPVDAGAGTPDCALYASTTGLVMSTFSTSDHRIGLCGQGLVVSTIMPNPLSWAHFMIMGAIFWRIR